MAVDHSAWVAIGLFVAYAAVVAVSWRVTGTRYDQIVASRRTVVLGIVVSIGLGALVLVVATTWLGWWEAALFPARSGPGWTLVVPALFGLVALINIARIDFRSSKARILPVLAIGVLLVGFAEELVSRGTLVVGLRESGAGGITVWLVTALLFSLLHAMNALFGQSLRTTGMQLIMAFLAGTALFVTLLSTGSLIVAMVLHALWDFGSLGLLATERTQRPIAGLLALAAFAAGLAAVWFVV